MGADTDQQNTSVRHTPEIGGQKSDGATTEKDHLAQNTVRQNTEIGQSPNPQPDEKPMSPTRKTMSPTSRANPIRNLGALLDRPNVEWIQVLRPTSVRIAAKFVGDISDTKNYVVGDNETGGCVVILHLSDNPAGVGDNGFFDIGGKKDVGDIEK